MREKQYDFIESCLSSSHVLKDLNARSRQELAAVKTIVLDEMLPPSADTIKLRNIQHDRMVAAYSAAHVYRTPDDEESEINKETDPRYVARKIREIYDQKGIETPPIIMASVTRKTIYASTAQLFIDGVFNFSTKREGMITELRELSDRLEQQKIVKS